MYMNTIIIGKKEYRCKKDALAVLATYIQDIESNFRNDTDISDDIKIAIAELLDERIIEKTDTTISLSDVTYVTQTLGTIEQIVDDSNTNTPDHKTVQVVQKKLYRDIENKWIAGVASGLATYFGIPVWSVRLAFIIALVAPIPSIIPYILLWIIMPKAKTKTDKLRMYGQPVDLTSLSNQSSSFKKRAITTAKLVGVVLGLVVALGFMLLTLFAVGLWSYTNAQMDMQAEPERNVYEYSCESGEELQVLQAESGAGNVMIVGEKENMHQGEYALLYENDSSWVYETPTFLEIMQVDDTWQFEIAKKDLSVTALNRHTEARDSCTVITIQPSSQNRRSPLENLADFQAIESCLDAGSVWDAAQRTCLLDN